VSYVIGEVVILLPQTLFSHLISIVLQLFV
jgi:hypothetical protein